jgi:hypothetical protein
MRISRPPRSKSRPSESFLRLHTMGSFRDRCFVLKKGGRQRSIFTTIRIRRNNCIGTVKTYAPRAITDQCGYTITHPGPRTSNGSSILTPPFVGRS